MAESLKEEIVTSADEEEFIVDVLKRIQVLTYVLLMTLGPKDPINQLDPLARMRFLGQHSLIVSKTPRVPSLTS